MQIYDFTVAVNQQRQLDAPGTYFYYYSGSAGGADQTITLRGVSSGLRIVIKNGQSLRLPADAKPETSWYIGNYANQATIIGTVIIGSGEIQDNRIQGSVEVVDGGKSRSLANGAYSQIIAIGALAANFSYAQLWNPSGSGKNCIVEQITMASGTATSYYHQFNTAAAAVLIPQQAKSKLLNAAVNSIAQMRTGQTASPPGTSYFMSTGAILTQVPYMPKEPIVIPPGVGLCIVTAAINQDVTAVFEWYEESAS